MKYQMVSNMKISPLLTAILVLSVIATAVAGNIVYDCTPYPQPNKGFVTDIANLLTDQQQASLEELLLTTEKQTNIKITVVTINSISDYPQASASSIDTFTKGMFEKYREAKLLDSNGVVLLVAAQDRKARIELGTAYSKRRVDDANLIMQNRIVPLFKMNKYDEGIIFGTRAVITEFAKIRSIPLWVNLLTLIFILVFTPVTFSLYRNGKRGWGWVIAGFIIIIALVIFNLINRIFEHMSENDSYDGWFDNDFGGGFSGGVFSSGGGGGATGSW